MDEKKVREAIYCIKASIGETMCEECVNYYKCDHTKMDDMMRTAIEALEKQLPRKVEINMPKKEGVYLVTCDDEKYPVKRMRFKNGIWLWHYGIYDGKILAYQPLPEPYKPEEGQLCQR